ncbi:alpha/beta hydrolase fold domain-containing protein [Parvibaculum sedimenti]|uniref:Alpha/beta hydrolase fold domain-containing protein n=1 Tax=Parvibaculum sedimenti TaxID=2608632 RepID=A0A6N6VED9_9HYPH|nr:alpha/beta hydrolase [Parvibaculum sedimenti]KAB7738599.1 alpha/beta hydrolase fold domain-containing protein [Parvibaculum sedimenti]
MKNQEIIAIREFLGSMPEPADRAELRQTYDNLGAIFPTAADVALESVSANGVPAEWATTPGAAPDRVVMYVHGGGYVIGSVKSHRHLVTELGRAAGTRTLSVDYRLAPEHPFPAAVDDALAAYRYLLAQGFVPGNIAIAGDSAGGGLTVATLLAIRDAGLEQPACAFCISPWIDLEATGNSITELADIDPMVSREGLAGMAAAYLGAASAKTPLASPLHAEYRDLAPLLIHVGAAETLLDDSIRLAGKAGAADVDVTLKVWPEMIHVWHFFHPMLETGRHAIAQGGEFIGKAMDDATKLKVA